MKRILALTLCLCLFAACLSGCAVFEQLSAISASSEPRQPVIPSNVEDTPTEPDTQLLYYDAIYEAIDEDADTAEYFYSFHVPQINAQGVDIDYVNELIMQDFGTTAQEAMDAAEQGVSTGCYMVAWDCYCYEDFFALVLSKLYEGDSTYHTVYTLDRRSGQLISDDEILAYCGLTKEEFYSRLTDAVDAAFRSYWPESYLEDEGIRDSYNERLAWSVSPENIQNYHGLFLRDDGTLMAIVDIGSLAGAASYENLLELPLS